MGGVIPFNSDAALAGDATAALPEDVDEVAARTAHGQPDPAEVL